jgi:hypothetical protein
MTGCSAWKACAAFRKWRRAWVASFTYCTLGEAVELDKLLSGEKLPAFDALGAWLFYTATGGALPPVPPDAPEWYLGLAQDAHVWLVYQPDLVILKSPQAALTLSLAEQACRPGAEPSTRSASARR